MVRSMRVKKPINWRNVLDRRGGDWKRMKGDFGEYIVREYLESKGLALERMQKRAEGLPDFKVKGKPVMVEVKSHMVRVPQVWQKKRFMSLKRMGWRILIARPRIFRKWEGESIVCAGIDWYEFVEDGKLRTLEDFPFEKSNS
jgi:hypothetical protein